MASLKLSFRKWLRQFFGPTFREMSRTGKIVQTLWDAAGIQSQQRAYLQRIGEIAIGLSREGKVQDAQIERLIAKLDRSERILKRQELMLTSYQSRSDGVDLNRHERASDDRNLDKDRLEPV